MKDQLFRGPVLFLWLVIFFFLAVGCFGIAPDLSWPWSLDAVDTATRWWCLGIGGIVMVVLVSLTWLSENKKSQ